MDANEHENDGVEATRRTTMTSARRSEFWAGLNKFIGARKPADATASEPPERGGDS